MDWLTQERARAYHKVASLFPLMDGNSQEFSDLCLDIKENGLLEPIWLHPDGSIIDGRNRHRACILARTRPRFRTWDGQGSLVGLVVSLNLHRRHLTSSQRAVVALDILPMLEEEAKERQRGGQGGVLLVELFPQATEQGKARDQAAQFAQTNPRYVSDAKRIRTEAPDLLEQVRDGEMSIPQAKRELTKRIRQDADPVPFPAGIFSVIYADPPWAYDNSGFDQSAESHYPTMATQEIAALPIGELCDERTVLFLWATSPLLDQAFKVIKAWGFTYKASMVWDKERAPGIGWFVQTEHEFLLIATRSQNTHPKVRPKSVVRAPVGQHSAKPPIFYSIIESMYSGPYCELFARATRNGWESWGNEI